MLNCPNCTAPLTAQTAHCPTCGVSLQTTAIPHTWSQRATPDDQLRVDDLLYNSDVYPRASLWRRFVAYLIDSLIFGVLFVPAIVTVATENDSNTAASTNLAFVILLLVPFVYFIGKDSLFRGRSLGKMAMGLMIVDVANQVPCGAGKAIARNLVGFALAFVPLGSIVDVVLILTDPEGRRLGDRVCRTQVVPQSAYHKA
ncbi:hypothetical protein DCC81_16210 [Chitinophaga parva]|uniref:RDD domain-containing protein n=1 Tax=Chitinophaga parva TaxID=2169414 RepID=A0A2T7BHT0_9BACT|nr:RDD family protein [Chitinophaga parva]PUZ25803.1 hypothetical protein DCC81_16210 [Chitinophaga parva]